MGLMDSLKKAKEKYSRNQADTYRLKEGKTRLRILPYIAPGKKTGPGGEFHCDIGVHWIKTSLGGKPVAVVGASDVTYGTHNPINDAIDQAAQLAKQVDDEMVKLVSEWKARKSVLVNALIRTKGSSDASEDDVKIVELTPTTFGEISKTLLMYVEEGGAEGDEVLSLEKGVDMIIEKTGKGMDTRYSVMPAPGSSPPVNAGVLEKLNDLPQFIANRYFRGEETKALTAIQAVTGVSGPALGSRPATAMLTARGEETAARVTPKPAPVEEVEAPKKPATAAELPSDEVDALMRELENIS
jgi:hypothetical protein